jgi:hypothetical protein
MHLTRLLRLGVAGVACALVLFAADFWKTKDSAMWTSEEINKLLSDSPWARAKTVQPDLPQQRRGMGRRSGGFGYPGGGYPGGGYPGGGGGYPGGGGGYPGGGGGYPGGSNGGGSNGDGSQAGPMNLTIRWASALPVQQALMRQTAEPSDELKAATAATEKYYVITVLGLRLPRSRNSSSSYPDDQSSNNDDNSQRRNQNNDALRSQLLDAAQLAPKGQSSIYAQDVQIDGPDGIDGVRFLFPRANHSIAAGDKEVDFILNIRRVKVQEKFHLNDMQYQGKLAL